MPDSPRPAPSIHGDRSPSPLLLTADEFERRRGELRELRRIRDADLPQLLRAAKTFVDSDASEEIAQIAEDHAVVLVRIAWLERLLDEAAVLAPGADPQLATVGRAVDVEYVRTGRRKTYVLAGTVPHGPQGVSARSPVGAALMGRTGGEVVEVELPGGRVEALRILAVRDPGREASAA